MKYVKIITNILFYATALCVALVLSPFIVLFLAYDAATDKPARGQRNWREDLRGQYFFWE